MATMTGLEFEIRGDTSLAIKSLDRLRDSIKGVKTAAKRGIGFSSAAKDIRKFANILGKIDTKKFESLRTATRSINSLSKALSNFSDNPEAFEQVYESLYKLSLVDFTNLQTAAENIKKIAASANEISGKTTESSDADTSRKKLDLLGKSATFFKSAVSRATSPVKEFAGKLGNVAAAFKRIVFYRIIRSIIREIGDAFKYGVNNLYAWSNGIGGEFASSMDRISTAFAYFKNSIGAAVAPIVNALAPAIDFVIDKAVTLLNVINQLFAKLTGASYWTKATKQATSYGDAVSSAGSAAKEALRYLAPFDELNVLPSNSSGGGGGGGGGSDAGGLFEIQESFSDAVSNFADMIKAAWDSGDWEEVGRFLGGKVNELIDSIDWAGMGVKVGKFINAWFGVQYWTLDEINFTNLGNKIGEFVNNALSNINFDIAGRLPVKQLTSILDTIIGFLDELDWGLVSSSISSFIKGAFNEASDWISGINWSSMGSKLYQNLKNFFAGIDWAGLASSAFTLLGNALSAAVGFLSEFFSEIWEDIKTWWNTEIQGVSFSETVTNLWNALSDAIGNIDELVKTNIVNPFFNALIGEDKWVSVQNWFINGWNGIIDKLSESKFVTNFLDFFDINLDDLKIDPIEIPATANLTGSKDSLTKDQKTVPTTSKFTSALNKLTTTQSTIATKANFTSYKKGFGSYVDAKANLTTYRKAWGSWVDAKANLTKYYRGWTGGPWIDTKANLTNYYRDWSGAPWIDAKANITKASVSASNGIIVSGGLTLYTKALGGALFGGKWHDIPQYASGTLNAGSMFVAGEAGPELVGHINGRTEVLNASQIASAIAAGVSAATYTVNGGGMDEDVLYRAFVRALNDSESGGDIYLDGERIFQSVARHNRQNTRMTGVNAFA